MIQVPVQYLLQNADYIHKLFKIELEIQVNLENVVMRHVFRMFVGHVLNSFQNDPTSVVHIFKCYSRSFHDFLVISLKILLDKTY